MKKSNLNSEQIRRWVSDVLKGEAAAISGLADALPAECVAVVELLLRCDGRVIVTGMGKMSAIARKTAATLSSVGTPAIFLHPGEAMHGDLGIVTSSDILLALSNSGETNEILDLIPHLKRNKVPIISITGSLSNALSSVSDLNMATGVTREADDITQAPTNSTTATLALCDALAIALVHLKGFTAEQFAANHPGGQIGRNLLLRVSDLMATESAIPVVACDASLRDTIVVISQGKLGAGFIIDSSQHLLGILTDGDLRRILERDPNPLDQPVADLMTRSPRTLTSDLLAVQALTLMNDCQITVMPVVDNGIVIGALHLHELLKAGLG
ncbi:MAG: KpsF/GutQ family sugar-phosphate isomerase [Planctomycetaceae bacterium]|nr:KpsF/GutQ family sugar-phosphate isomerase [Planctomycetaceae bacterium]MCP4463164.1 KpsF/GutQ family sugar-phosphate isomerase [Planctomycetaceae bacterium]MDG1809200.1 KpsF/GutQ family sugar-phosphate isomerase [Pirellulaceae bacterium]MDG2105443.1 KpsF/GutQ family sugar-phosphate isomerase [Pirellulaceae bacterium]